MTPSITYSIEASARLVRVDYIADATFEVWASVMEAIIAEPQYRPGFSFLVDRLMAEAPSTADLRRMVTFVELRQAAFANSRWAIITYSEVDYGMGRMSQALAADHPTTIRIFSDRGEGLRWLSSPGEDSDR